MLDVGVGTFLQRILQFVKPSTPSNGPARNKTSIYIHRLVLFLIYMMSIW
jgi:hypothetical protein